jgi:ankyrin repeat protein
MTQPGPQEHRKFVIDCWNGMVESIEATLAEYPDAVHWKDPNTGGTGLLYAIEHGSHKLNIAEILLAAGADVDAGNATGKTPLMAAAENGGFSSVEWLLDHGARPDVKDGEGKTAADWARGKNQERMAAFLDDYAQALALERAEAETAARKINAAQDSESAHAGLSARLTVKKPLRVQPRRLR